MTYFHPRDFDVDQPIIEDLSVLRHFKTYTGIKSCKSKLENWLSNFDFVDLSTADSIIDWDDVPIVNL